ncbi:MAG: Na/Pi cotransporter family protein [Magnetovibrionaceae bacterium]
MGDLNLFDLLMGLFGGLALFLLGMEQMSSALKEVAGDRMRWVLGRLTGNRFMGAVTGAFVTAVIQSSSVTTVLVVGFVSAGLMSLTQSVGVIMGANVGTTVTAQIIAFKVTHYALLLVAAGFGIMAVAKAEKIKQYGVIILGLGLIFLGMAVMSEAMKPLRGFEPFIDLMAQVENPIAGILLAAVFTALVQSSSATTGIVIVLAADGFITLEAGIALAFGANIGTCVTALIATLGKSREAIRAAVVHVVFNIAGVVVWVALIDQLAEMVRLISPVAEELSGAAKRAAESPRQIANAHTIFNVANTLLFIGFAPWFAKIARRIVPDRPQVRKALIEPRFLSEDLLDAPVLALDAARLEIGRLGERVFGMSLAAFPALVAGDTATLAKVRERDAEADALHAEIIRYLRELGLGKLSDDATADMVRLMRMADQFEQIGDLVETDLVNLGEQRLSQKIVISSDTAKALEDLHSLVCEAVQIAILAAVRDEPALARQITAMKSEIKRRSKAAHDRIADRLTDTGDGSQGRLAVYALETEIIERLKRIYYFAKRIAKEVTGSRASQRAVEPLLEDPENAAALSEGNTVSSNDKSPSTNADLASG